MNASSETTGGTIGDMIITAFERYPRRIAFDDGVQRVSYAQTAARVSQIIQTFDALGLQPGETVLQLSGNRFETFCVIAAAYISGRRSVTLQPLASLEDQDYIARDSEARLAIVDMAYNGRAKALRSMGGAACQWYAHERMDGFESIWDVAARFAPLPLVSTTGPTDIVRLAYTGGTTGKPKGVMLSSRALMTNALLTLAANTWPEEVRFLCATPITHGGGSMIVPTLWHGGTFFMQHGFEPGRVLDAIERQRVNMMFLVPTMIYVLLDQPRTAATDFSGLHSLFYGAAPMSPARLREALQVFGKVMVQLYGQTECPNNILTMTREDHTSGGEKRLASAGRPFPGIEVRLLDERCAPVARGELGEICVRGPLVMSGYWKQPELTEAAMAGGWVHTGDVARQDDEGYFYIVDRKKDMIISGGFNVYPSEIENVLTSHPSVAAAAVIGVPDPKWGEAVKAIVVPKAGHEIDALDLMALVKEKKGSVATPKSVDLVEAIPLTVLGKPDKKALRQRYWTSAQRAVN